MKDIYPQIYVNLMASSNTGVQPKDNLLGP